MGSRARPRWLSPGQSDAPSLQPSTARVENARRPRQRLRRLEQCTTDALSVAAERHPRLRLRSLSDPLRFMAMGSLHFVAILRLIGPIHVGQQVHFGEHCDRALLYVAHGRVSAGLSTSSTVYFCAVTHVLWGATCSCTSASSRAAFP